MRALFLGSALAVVSGTLVLAADLGQYRPGNPYQSVIAPGADVCESHCAGDAQCRSWNYIKVNPQSAGVCEFNANDVAPVASAISISGANVGSSYRSGVVAGGTNTIRVGTQTISQPRASTNQASPNRRIVREPVPQQHRAQTASTHPVIRPTQPGSLTEQQNQLRQQTLAPQGQQQAPAMPQRFQYDLGGQGQVSPQMPQGQARPPQARPPQAMRPTFQRPQTGFAPQPTPQIPMTSRDRRRQQGPTAVPQEPFGQMQGQSFPPQAPQYGQPNAFATSQAPQSLQAPMARRSATQPMTYQNTPATMAASAQSPQQLARGLSADQAQQSLFGKLNDDVRVPNAGAVVPTDPNAPIATSASRPVQPVEQGVLNELAGPPQP